MRPGNAGDRSAWLQKEIDRNAAAARAVIRPKDWTMTENLNEATTNGGEFTTELGCRVLVIPPELRSPDSHAGRGPGQSELVFQMVDHPMLHWASVLLTDEERAKLKALL